jgi:hypothetical protein
MTGIKQNKITSANELTSVPTTPIEDNMVEEIIRVVLCIVRSNEKIILI